MNELTRYALDLIETQCRNLIFILPTDGSFTYNDFLQLKAILSGLDPTFYLTLKARTPPSKYYFLK